MFEEGLQTVEWVEERNIGLKIILNLDHCKKKLKPKVVYWQNYSVHKIYHSRDSNKTIKKYQGCYKQD